MKRTHTHFSVFTHTHTHFSVSTHTHTHTLFQSSFVFRCKIQSMNVPPPTVGAVVGVGGDGEEPQANSF